MSVNLWDLDNSANDFPSLGVEKYISSKGSRPIHHAVATRRSEKKNLGCAQRLLVSRCTAVPNIDAISSVHGTNSLVSFLTIAQEGHQPWPPATTKGKPSMNRKFISYCLFHPYFILALTCVPCRDFQTHHSRVADFFRLG